MVTRPVLNGHEWANRRAIKLGIGFTELANGFATCEDPAGRQAICDRRPATIGVFFERWMSRLPLPLGLCRSVHPGNSAWNHCGWVRSTGCSTSSGPRSLTDR